ncbi:xylose isomerase [Gemmatimonadetes bacterium T265]|nr:xylose isomerase [Gemmatimonadetes bacterium T265]
MLRYAYNTNGTAHHRLDDALAFVADSGYDGVALTLDVHHLDPFAPDLPGRARALARRLRELGLGLVVETGARYLLDPRAKHEPTLVTPSPEGRARRVDFLRRCLDVCAECGGETVSFWAGVPRPGVDPAAAWEWLAVGVAQVVALAAERGVVASLEPEPGMLVETVDDWRRLRTTLGTAAPPLRLALDTGHCLVTGDRDPAAAVRECAADLGTVAVEDMRRGVHEHLPFGEGDVDTASVLRALADVGFDRLVTVELSRDSHRAHEVVPKALADLKTAERAA